MALDEYGEWSYLGFAIPRYFQWISTGLNSSSPSQILRVSFRNLPSNPTYSKIRIRGILYAPTTTIVTQSRIVYPSPEKQVIELSFPLVFLNKSEWQLGIEVLKIKFKKWSDLDKSQYIVDVENYKGNSIPVPEESFDETLDYLEAFRNGLED